MIIFCLGILIRQTLGKWCGDQASAPTYCNDSHLTTFGTDLFGSVPESCFTVFRCLVDGCTSADGTPLLLHVMKLSWYGKLIVGIYVLVFLVVTFGLFNLIMAVFVEKTMEAARLDDERQRSIRKKEYAQMARRLNQLGLYFCKYCGAESGDGSPKASMVTPADGLSKAESNQGRASISSWLPRALQKQLTTTPEKDVCETVAEGKFTASGLSGQITRRQFEAMVADPNVQQLLEELDVRVSDHARLFDALDAQGAGSLQVQEVLQGIVKFHGDADKADAVASLLTARATQDMLRQLRATLSQSLRDMTTRQVRLELKLDELSRASHDAGERPAHPSSAPKALKRRDAGTLPFMVYSGGGRAAINVER